MAQQSERGIPTITADVWQRNGDGRAERSCFRTSPLHRAPLAPSTPSGWMGGCNAFYVVSRPTGTRVPSRCTVDQWTGHCLCCGSRHPGTWNSAHGLNESRNGRFRYCIRVRLHKRVAAAYCTVSILFTNSQQSGSESSRYEIASLALARERSKGFVPGR